MAIVLLGPPVPPAAAEARYSLANGCYSLRAQSSGRVVAKTADGYRAGQGTTPGAEPFRMQATDLGSYLLYGRERDFLAANSNGDVAPAASPSEQADWRVDDAGGGASEVSLPAAGKALAVASGSGELVLARSAERFVFEPAEGCATYPEVEVNATGTPSRGATPFGEVRGLLDMHTHLMGFEAYGGEYHCGRPWHRYGAAYALPDCADIYGPQASAASVQNVVDSGSPVAPHDTRGWPTFHDWPAWNRSNYEQLYYKWLERAWRAGLRIFVPLHNDNQQLCQLMVRRHTNCNEMDTVRRQIRDTYELQDYIDAQSGGPGKGWFRVVTDPFEARRVINDGKLAVVQGIETSVLLDCNVYNDVPRCDRGQIDRGLEEVYRLGVRQMELLNIFDNAFAGVQGTGGAFGVVVNTANFLQTGRFFALQTCTGPAHDSAQETHTHGAGRGLEALLPPGTVPVYPPPPHCNARGLSPLGEYLIRRMMARGMIVDPDHLSATARSQALALIGAEDYSGVISSHGKADDLSYPEIHRLGGVVTPYGLGSEDFVEEWRERRREAGRRYYFGFGYGSDVHGITFTPGPRTGPNSVRYPFTSFDGAVTLDRQRSGERTFDVNEDGVAHYGLYPDWIEDLRMIAGDEIVADMARGPEAYLQMWERAEGIPGPRCQPAAARLGRRGLGSVRLGQSPDALLRRAGQPQQRTRVWRWCVQGRRNRDAAVMAAFTPGGRVGLVLSTSRAHEAGRIAPGASARRLRGRARPISRGVWVTDGRLVYGVRGGRVRYVAVASPQVAASSSRLRRYVRLALGSLE